MELAHIAMGHHIDTRYAFNDRLMFPDESTFQRIDMYHSDHDNAEAAKKAMEYLQNSMYKDKLSRPASTMRSWSTGRRCSRLEHA